VSMWLIKNTGSTSAVAYYLMGACAVTIGSTVYALVRARLKFL
jgi:hypothetical protein